MYMLHDPLGIGSSHPRPKISQSVVPYETANLNPLALNVVKGPGFTKSVRTKGLDLCKKSQPSAQTIRCQDLVPNQAIGRSGHA